MKKCLVTLKKILLILILSTLFKSFICSIKWTEAQKGISSDKFFLFLNSPYKIKRNNRSNLNIYFYKNISRQKYLLFNEYYKNSFINKNILFNFETSVYDKKINSIIRFYKSEVNLTRKNIPLYVTKTLKKNKIFSINNDKSKLLKNEENKNNLNILQEDEKNIKENNKENGKEKKKGKEEEEQTTLTRSFLTDTKYYKRSKYSKAGFLKEKKNGNFEKKEENFIFDDFLNDKYSNLYTESKEDILKRNLKKNTEKENISLPTILMRNYFSDTNRTNDLDLINKISINDMKINSISDTVNGTSEKEIKENNNKKTCFMNEFTVIGEIVGVHGLLGYVKVVSFTTFNDIRFKDNCYRYLFMNNYSYPLPIKIVNVRESFKINFLYIKFEGIDTRTDALKLKSCLICDDKKTFPDIGENKYLSTDLLNFDIYIFNDFSNTSIGKIFSFISKYDYIHNRSIQEISDDLIKIELNKNISLKKVFNIINLAKTNNNSNSENDSSIKNWKPIELLIHKNNLNVHDDKLSELKKRNKNNYDTEDNLEGFSYKKIYKCDYCDHVFDNINEASVHENSHFGSDEELFHNSLEVNSQKEKIYEVTQADLEKIKNVEYFFIPIVKEKTIRSVNYENKKIYLDISTVFLMDDQK